MTVEVVEPPILVLGDPVVLGSLYVAEPVSLAGILQVEAAVRLPVLTYINEHWVWVGEGEPGIIPGAESGALYLDELTGILYRLT